MNLVSYHPGSEMPSGDAFLNYVSEWINLVLELPLSFSVKNVFLNYTKIYTVGVGSYRWLPDMGIVANTLVAKQLKRRLPPPLHQLMKT